MTLSKHLFLLSLSLLCFNTLATAVKRVPSSIAQAPTIVDRLSEFSNIYLPKNELTPNPVGEISYLKLTNRDPDCAAYVGQYQATIFDCQQGEFIKNRLQITADKRTCTFRSNNIPNHDVGNNTITIEKFSSKVTATR